MNKANFPRIVFITSVLLLYSLRINETTSSTRSDNPLFIPETRRDKVTVSNLFYAIGEHDALGYTPFGIETIDNGIDPWSAGFLPPNHFMIMESAGVGHLLS